MSERTIPTSMSMRDLIVSTYTAVRMAGVSLYHMQHLLELELQIEKQKGLGELKAVFDELVEFINCKLDILSFAMLTKDLDGVLHATASNPHSTLDCDRCPIQDLCPNKHCRDNHSDGTDDTSKKDTDGKNDETKN